MATPETQREAMRAQFAQLSPAVLEYVDLQVDHGLTRVSPASCDCCGAGSSFRLNPDVVPGWLRDVIGHGTPVYGQEAGYPQLCRVSSYVDWLSAASTLGDRLTLDDQWSPTTVAAKWVEIIRRPSTIHEIYGHNERAESYLDVAIWVDEVDRFSAEVWAIALSAPLPSQMYDHLMEEVQSAREQCPSGAGRDTFYDVETLTIQFC